MLRTWTKKRNTILQPSHFLEIWDGGSIRYERITGATTIKETCWEILDRAYTTESSFTETVKELPPWVTPVQVTFQERVPVLLTARGFEIPGCIIEHPAKENRR